jgi:hypothetical protein
VAEYDAAHHLSLQLAAARQSGYDAIEQLATTVRWLQAKGRCLTRNPKPGQRIGATDAGKEWDAVLLVLLDEDFEATEIYEAERVAVIAALTKPGSRLQNERYALNVNKFKSIGRRRWPK